MDIKNEFPIFQKHPDLVYLDSAATSLKPKIVIDTVTEYLSTSSTNVGRGLYPLAEATTERFEGVRKKVAGFIGAAPEEIIFTSGTTDGINLAAQMLAGVIPIRRPADEGSLTDNTKIPPLEDSVGMTNNKTRTVKLNIVVSTLEHHSNFLPWKELANKNDLEFRIAPISNDGLIDIEKFSELIDRKTRIIACSAISNVTSGINPIADIVRIAKKRSPKAIVVVDAAQAASHVPIDVTKWDADFIAFSGHKMYGPTGIGILYGKKEILEQCAPVVFGGGMVTDSCADPAEYREIPYRFEAGTPNIGGVFGLGVAIDFIQAIGIENIRTHDIELSEYAIEKLREIFGDAIRIVGPTDSSKRAGLVSFTLNDIHPHDLAQLLGEQNICIRAGEHCAAPLHRTLGIPATARISFGIYTAKEDIDKLIMELEKIQKFLQK